jgi:trans-aconitate methyltransferase/methyltransferase-like protein
MAWPMRRADSAPGRPATELPVSSPEDHATMSAGSTVGVMPSPCSETEPGGDYNLLPYPSMPFADTQPAHLAALAILFGLNPPDIRRARILELGCASGGNIIPLAVRFREASFIGIDLSRRHIDDGNMRIASLALENINLVQADLATLNLAGQQFDYIICNGVFSWVPKPAQDGIFRLCRQTLAVNGVLTISYNVLPGWHLRMVIRDLCLRYAGTEGSPQQRVAKARMALEEIAEAAEKSDPYGKVLKTEARRLKNVPSSYILGEFLAPDNVPCSIEDFIGRAADWGFDYLCEADLCAGVPQTLDPELRKRITTFYDPDRAANEQHLDFLTGRLFRRSVLVRKQPAGTPAAAPNMERLDALHISSTIRFDATKSTDQAAVFTDDQARPVTIRDPLIRRAIARLESTFPATLTVSELCGAAGDDLPEDIAPRIRRVVYAMLMAGRANASSVPLQTGHATDERPKAWSMARLEAASGQPWITSLRHVGMAVNPILRVLLADLDGHHDRGALQTKLAAALCDGVVAVPELRPDHSLPSQERINAIAVEHVGWGLGYLARHGYLEA